MDIDKKCQIPYLILFVESYTAGPHRQLAFGRTAQRKGHEITFKIMQLDTIQKVSDNTSHL